MERRATLALKNMYKMWIIKGHGIFFYILFYDMDITISFFLPFDTTLQKTFLVHTIQI